MPAPLAQQEAATFLNTTVALRDQQERRLPPVKAVKVPSVKWENGHYVAVACAFVFEGREAASATNRPTRFNVNVEPSSDRLRSFFAHEPGGAYFTDNDEQIARHAAKWATEHQPQPETLRTLRRALALAILARAGVIDVTLNDLALANSGTVV